MAGSRRSPVLRDQWSADHERDPRDGERRRGRGQGRDRGRGRGRDRGRPHRPNNRNFDGPGRSPPRASRFGPDSSHDIGDFGPERSHPPGSPEPPNFHNSRRPDINRLPSSTGDWNSHPSAPFDRDTSGFHRDESTNGPPFKRQRTRSPSPGGRRGPLPPRSNFPPHGEGRDRSPPYRKRGGRNQGRGAPRRGRERRGKDRRQPAFPRPGRSRSPGHERGFHPSPDGRPRTPGGDNYGDNYSNYGDDRSDHGSHYRSTSRHSIQSHSKFSTTSHTSRRNSAMNSSRPTQSGPGDNARSPSPRPIPSFNSENLGPSGEQFQPRDAYPTDGTRHGVKNQSRRRNSRPNLDNRPYPTSPQHDTSAGSFHGSPPPHSPYSAGRGGWNGPSSYPGPGHVSPYHKDNYSSHNGPSGAYYHNQGQHNGPGNHPSQSSYGGPPHRGGHSGGGHRGNFSSQGPDRRFSGSGSHSYQNGPPQRGGRGHFSNLQWTASGSRGRGGQHSPRPDHRHRSQSPNRSQSHHDPESPRTGDLETRSRPSNRELMDDRGFHGNEDSARPPSDSGNVSSTQPPTRESNDLTPVPKGGKFSFAFKSKAAPSPAPKPVPDLAQRMQIREPIPRAPAQEPTSPRNRLTNGPLPKFKPDTRHDRRDRARERGDRDRRDFREPRDFRDPRNRRDDRRFDQNQRRDRRKGERPPNRPADRQERWREPFPEPTREPPKQKVILTRPKARPTLPDEFANADSVYYRKPGNESVIGAGTYGKVFKGIHVYTQRKVALKKIRMEGEKDGFPITAVREIKLLQHLRNHNVVSLLEVMVEKNECFMVFEYLSHDLTGLINHPTFSLSLAHKKDLSKQMFEGLNYLHHRGVLHRDIKAANILISNRGLLKYADFGLARFFSKSRQLDYTNRVITIWYRPPELLLGETRYGPAVDVWSAACVCMEMFTKKAVFPGEGGELSQMEKLYNALGTPTKTEWPDLVEMPWFHLMRPKERRKRVFEEQYRDILSTQAMDLISSVFQYDPARRPSAEAVLQHPYFTSEEPTPHPPIELEHVEGDWHEFESKALRKEARRVEYQNQKDRDKRKADNPATTGGRDSKRPKQDTSDQVSH